MKLAAAAAQAFLRAPDPAMRAALLYGPNRTRVADAAAALTLKLLKARDAASIDGFALTRLNEDDVKRDKARLGDALAAQSLLGGGGMRLVRLRSEGDGAADAALAALAMLEGAPEAAFLMVEAGDLAARSRMRAGFEKSAIACAIAFYEDEPKDLFKFAEATAAEAGASLAPGALEALLANLPNDRGVARAEIDKLALFGHGLGRPVSVDETLALVSGEAEAEVDAAIAAALGGDGARALEALARSAAGGVSALKALERRLLRLMEAQTLIGGGLEPSEALGKLRPPVFWKEKDATLGLLRVWSAARLERGLEVAWRAQIAAMSGGAPQEAIAAGAFREVARLARR